MHMCLILRCSFTSPVCPDPVSGHHPSGPRGHMIQYYITWFSYDTSTSQRLGSIMIITEYGAWQSTQITSTQHNNATTACSDHWPFWIQRQLLSKHSSDVLKCWRFPDNTSLNVISTCIVPYILTHNMPLAWVFTYSNVFAYFVCKSDQRGIKWN